MVKPVFTLTRITSAKDGVLGVLHDSNNAYCVTLEDPWDNNRVGNSCILPGAYEVVPHSGTKYKNVWRLLNVPGRSAILIHAGNSQKDTQGCILVGTSYVPDQTRIANSQAALNNLRIMLPKEFTLVIKDAVTNYGGMFPAYNKPQPD